jgi:uracil-DNA glycosylase
MLDLYGIYWGGCVERILQLHYKFYENMQSDLEIRETLEREKITVLDGFHKNYKLVSRYYKTVYSNQKARVVLCGINPGRNGAGKTGIPFLDFDSVSQLISNIDRRDKELSAQFIKSIIDELGSEAYYKGVYMTNISWYGFVKNNKNLNYYDLPESLQTIFTDSFIEEMDIVEPKVIVPLSQRVEKTLKQMKKEGKLQYLIASRLPHPYYCSIGKNAIKYKDVYLRRLNDLMKDKSSSLL